MDAALYLGDCLDVMRSLKSDSVEAMITDPPAGISFMGKSWDGDKGGRDSWIAWMTHVMQEAYRVLKPGAHSFVWALPRTSHWTATALENAGFEVRDIVTHIFGTGFPKSLDVSKAIDKAAGAEREVIGEKGGRYATPKQDFRGGQHHANADMQKTALFNEITAPATDAAKQWQGWGTALKPASEHWILIRKPMGEKTVASNLLTYGTGAINIDASRVGHSETIARPPLSTNKHNGYKRPWNENPEARKAMEERKSESADKAQALGRFPANLIFSHSAGCVEVGTKKVNAIKGGSRGAGGQYGSLSPIGAQPDFKPGYGDADGTETVAAWQCSDGCAVKALDEQSGTLKSGTLSPANNVKASSGWSGGSLANRVKNTFTANEGGASRFFKDFKTEMLCGPENTKEEDTFAGKITENKSNNLSTDGCGSSTTDQYLMGTISITRTTTRLITIFPILSVSTNILIGTCTIESEKTTPLLTESNIESVNLVSNTEAWIILKDEDQEPIKGTASLALNSNFRNGERKTENTITPITETTAKSRFFYCAKASKADKGEGNSHPTVKSSTLMEYLIRLITPPNGIVLDPFMGSGSTGVAAKRLGYRFIGIEQSQEYFSIAEKRLQLKD